MFGSWTASTTANANITQRRASRPAQYCNEDSGAPSGGEEKLREVGLQPFFLDGLFRHWPSPRPETSSRFCAFPLSPHPAKHGALLSLSLSCPCYALFIRPPGRASGQPGSRPVNISARWTRINNHRAALCVTVTSRAAARLGRHFGGVRKKRVAFGSVE